MGGGGSRPFVYLGTLERWTLPIGLTDLTGTNVVRRPQSIKTLFLLADGPNLLTVILLAPIQQTGPQ